VNDTQDAPEWAIPSNGRFTVEYPPMVWNEEIQNWQVDLEAAKANGWRFDQERNEWSKPWRS